MVGGDNASGRPSGERCTPLAQVIVTVDESPHITAAPQEGPRENAAAPALLAPVRCSGPEHTSRGGMLALSTEIDSFAWSALKRIVLVPGTMDSRA